MLHRCTVLELEARHRVLNRFPAFREKLDAVLQHLRVAALRAARPAKCGGVLHLRAGPRVGAKCISACIFAHTLGAHARRLIFAGM